MKLWSKRQKDLEEELCIHQIPFIDSLICFVYTTLFIWTVVPLALMHLTIVALALVISACIPLPGKWYETQRMSKRGGEQDWDRWRTKWKRSFWDDDTEHRHAGRQTQTLSTYCHCLANVPVYLCICVCAHLWKCRQWDNAVWAVVPTQCGNIARLSQVQIPGTRTDRQADGETVDHKQLSAAVLKPAHSQWETYWFLFLSFSTSKDFDLETPTWELAMIENSPYISEMKLQKNNAGSCREGSSRCNIEEIFWTV